MSTSTSPKHLWNKTFVLCLVNNFFLFVYYFALLAVLPIYIMKDLNGSIEEAGLALTLFLVSSIAVRPFSGLLIQKIGKKLAFRGSEFFFALFAISYIWIDSMWSLLLVRFLHGIWFSVLTTVTVPVASDFIPEERKGEGIGYFVMSTNLGVVFGPLLALTTIQLTSFKTLFAILAATIALGFVFCLLVQVKDEAIKPIQPTSTKNRLKLTDIIETRVIAVGIVACLVAISYSSVTSFITAYTEAHNLLAYTSIFFIVFAVSMIVVRPLVGKMYDRKGPSSVIYPSFIFFAIGLILVSLTHTKWLLWASAVFVGIGYGTLFPCLQTIAIQTVGRERMGHAISTFFTLFDIGLALGSVIMGLLIAQIGFQWTYIACAVLVCANIFLYRSRVVPTL